MVEKAQVETWKRMSEQELIEAVGRREIVDPEVLRVIALHIMKRFEKIKQETSGLNINTMQGEETNYRVYIKYLPGLSTYSAAPATLLASAKLVSERGPYTRDGFVLARYLLQEAATLATRDASDLESIGDSLDAVIGWNDIEILLSQ